MIKRFSKTDWLLFILFLTCVAVYCISGCTEWINNQYSAVYYPYFSCMLRDCFGGFRCSIGDILYLVLLLFLLFAVVIYFVLQRRKWRKDKDIEKPVLIWKKGLIAFFILYLLFFICWGFNYGRSGISADLKMKMKDYNKAELIDINAYLLKRLNENALMLDSLDFAFPENDSLLFSLTIEAYQKASKKFPFLNYKQPSLKPALFSTVMNYLGINGYYNPFTGEAQVNTQVPVFTKPFTTCHEIAHQLGYADESQASFIAFLVAEESGDLALLYSANFELFLIANRNLYLYDSASAKHWRDQLNYRVKDDIRSLKKHLSAYKNPFEPIVTKAYDLFLRSNRQKQGILSYNEVIWYLINYNRKTSSL